MEKVYYYNRNGVLQLTFGEAPYYMRLGTGKFKDQAWAYDDQFGLMKNFRRDQSSYPFSVVITSDDLADYDRLCDIFNDDIIANSPGYFLINGWELSCYVVKAEHEFYGRKDRVISFEAVSENSTWIRKNTRVLSGESAGESETDYGRDYTEGLIEAGSDTAPYLFRQSPQFSNRYNNETDTLVGGTVAWNQLISFTGTKTISAGTTTAQRIETAVPAVKDHKMLLMYDQTTTATSNTRNCPQHVVGGTSYSQSASTDFRLTAGCYYWLFNTEATGAMDINMWCHSADVDMSYKNWVLFDLTQMFGSTIADAIYAMEQSTAGSGVAFFKKLFPNSYYPYNSGELMSVSGVSSHDMTGFNQWDEEWELGYLDNSTGQNVVGATTIRSKNYIPVIPSTSYYFKSPNGLFVYFYDANKNFVGVHGGGTRIVNNSISLGANVHYIRFSVPSEYGTTYKNDICISISGSRNGEYEPYVKHSYALDSTLTLRGIPKLSNGNLYYDGDTYASDGTVTRKYGVVDLGTLTWSVNTSINVFYASLQNGKPIDTNPQRKEGIICSKYPVASGMIISSSMDDKSMLRNNVNNIGGIYIRDTSYTDATAFKTAMNGVYLVYELATPTTESADPYTNPQIVDDFGTEEYVTTSIVPVGHQTAYGPQAALRGYNYGYSLTDVHTTEIVLPSSQNGYEVLFYGPITNPAIYLNGHPVQVYVTLTAGQRLRVVSNGSEKTIKILSSTGVETDAFIYRNKEFSPFIDIGQHTEVSFGDFRFEFTTIERRSEPTWT